jgi:hypothetical protein
VITSHELKTTRYRSTILRQVGYDEERPFPITFKEITSVKPDNWKQVTKAWMVVFESRELRDLRKIPNGHDFHTTFAVKPSGKS